MIRFLKSSLLVLRKIIFFIHFKEISVLAYHSIGGPGELAVSKEAFEKQMVHLKDKGYHFISLLELIRYLKGDDKLPKKSVAITFDDGYEDTHSGALPILDKYHIPFGVFIIKDRLGENGFLNNEQLKSLSERGAEIGFHSKTHKNLAKLSQEELKDEVSSSMKFFAYPYGVFSKEVLRAVKDTGYEAAFSVKFGLINKKDDIFLIRRNVITAADTLSDLDFKTTYAINWYRKITNFIKWIK